MEITVKNCLLTYEVYRMMHAACDSDVNKLCKEVEVYLSSLCFVFNLGVHEWNLSNSHSNGCMRSKFLADVKVFYSVSV